MNYSCFIKGLFAELFSGKSYARLHPAMRVIMVILNLPLIAVGVGLLVAYHALLFLRNACAIPTDELETWLDKRRADSHFLPQAVLYFVTIPFIFFCRVLLSIFSFFFYFVWFDLMVCSYVVSLGGIRWQPFLNSVKYDDKKFVWKVSTSRALLNAFAIVNLVLVVLGILLIVLGMTPLALYLALIMTWVVYPLLFAKEGMHVMETDEDIYSEALYLLEVKCTFNVKRAKALLERIPNYNDSSDLLADCDAYLEVKRQKAKKNRVILFIVVAVLLIAAIVAFAIVGFIKQANAIKFVAVEGGYAVAQVDATIKSVKIPETFAGQPVVAINGKAFNNCDKLKKVTIPASVKKIESQAFYQCISLKDIRYKGTADEWNKINKELLWNNSMSVFNIEIECNDFIVKN